MKKKCSTLLSLNAMDMLSASIVPSNTNSDLKGSCTSRTGQRVLYQCNKTGQQIQQTLLETKSAHLQVLQSYTDCDKLPQAYTTNCRRHTQHKCPSKLIHLLPSPGGTRLEKVLHDMMAQNCFILQQKPFQGQICPAPASAATSPATPPQLLWPDFPSRNL